MCGSVSGGASGRELSRHRDQPAEDLPPRHPAVDAAAVVTDLKPLALDRLDEVQVLRAVRTAQHSTMSPTSSTCSRNGSTAQSCPSLTLPVML